MSNERNGFTSNFGAIVVAAGAAIGLGNVWRFPYVMGENGGAAFLIVYIAFTLFIGVPLVISEFVIGRHVQSNVVAAYRTLAPRHKIWQAAGWISIITSVLVYSFYSVVAGWLVRFIVLAWNGEMSGQSAETISQLFGNLITHPWHPIAYTGVVVVFTAMIVMLGVEKGIEKSSKLMMPLLFVLIYALSICTLTLPNARVGINFLFNPDFSSLTIRGVLMALGQSLFSVSIGSGVLIVYGSYIRKKDDLRKTSLFIAGADTLIAILSGIMIFPAVFSFGLSPTSGPSLIFETLPHVFNSIPFGIYFAVVFFILLTVASLTSTISMLEIPVSWTIEEFKISRRCAALLWSLVVFVLSILCSLSFGLLSDFKLAGQTIFDLFNNLTALVFMPFGAICAAIFVGWYLPKKVVFNEVSNRGKLRARYFKFWLFIIRFVAPVALLAVMIAGLCGLS